LFQVGKKTFHSSSILLIILSSTKRIDENYCKTYFDGKLNEIISTFV